jgi:hypothetical protein
MNKRSRPVLRTIIEQPLVTARINKSKQEYPGLEKMMDAVRWTLARNPIRGAKKVTSGEIVGYFIKTIPYPAHLIPSLTILYRVNEHEVIIDSLAISNGKDETEE